MNAVEIPQTDVIAKAPGCFDLPMAQGIVIEKTDTGQMVQAVPNLVTKWEFTDEEFQHMVAQKARGENPGVYVRLATAQTPPMNVTVENPFEIYDDFMTLKQAQQLAVDTTLPTQAKTNARKLLEAASCSLQESSQ